MCVHPYNFAIAVDVEAARDRADSLRVISAQNNWKVAFSDRPARRFFEQETAFIDICHVLRIEVLVLLRSKIKFFLKFKVLLVADPLFLRDWNFLVANVLH